MDGNLTNSKLLQHILESAETIKKEKGKKILTVNHVFAAVLQYCGDISNAADTFSEYDSDEVDGLYRTYCLTETPHLVWSNCVRRRQHTSMIFSSGRSLRSPKGAPKTATKTRYPQIYFSAV